MKFLYSILFIFCISFGIANSNAISSYEGKEFYIGFLDNEIGDTYPPFQFIYVTSNYNTEIELTYAGDTTYVFQIEKDEIYKYPIPSKYEHIESEVFNINKLVHVKSKRPVTITAKSYFVQSSDMFSIIPVRSWGKKYRVITMPNDYYIQDPINPDLRPGSSTPRKGEFLIMAAENNTNVSISVTADTEGGRNANSTFDITLNRGQSYLVKSFGVEFQKGNYDLTGSKIISDKPVGVLSGHMRTSIKQVDTFNLNMYSKDHIAEMLPPESGWGTEFFTQNFNVPVGSLFKVVSQENCTVTLYDEMGSTDYFVPAQGVLILDDIIRPTHWTSTAPIMIAQMMAKNNDEPSGRAFDPAMVIVPPLEQMISKVSYLAPNDYVTFQSGASAEQYSLQYVMLVADELAKDNLRYNNINIDLTWGFNTFIKENGEPIYYRLLLTPTRTSFINLTTTEGEFIAIPCATGWADSYAMNIGSGLSDVKLVDSLNPKVVYEEDCGVIEGRIFDDEETELAGLYDIDVDEENTFNYDFDIPQPDEAGTLITFSANPIDLFQPARLKFSAYDNTGNKEDFDFQYVPLNFQATEDISFGRIDESVSICDTFRLVSNEDSLAVFNVDFPEDSRISTRYLSNPQFPLYMMEGDTLEIEICFTAPEGDYSNLKDSIEIAFDCNFNYSSVISASTNNYALTPYNLDFGDILVGDTVCTDSSQYIFFVNDGNTDLVVTGLDIPSDEELNINIQNMFPDTLAPGDTLFIRDICLLVDSSGVIQYGLHTENNRGLDSLAFIYANGINPEINSISIDFGRTRIGYRKDTTAIIKNNGFYNSNAELIYANTNISNDPNEQTINDFDVIDFQYLDEHTFNFSYQPTLVEDYNYNLEAYYKEEWRFHDSILINIKGIPTIPKVDTYIIDFDTVMVGNFKDLLAKVISNTGNEKLTIENIFIIEGNQQVFEFDNSFYNLNQLDTNSNEELQIRFSPLDEEEYLLKIGVLNDALPNYETKVDTIIFRGVGVLSDSLLVESWIEDFSPLACVDTTIKYGFTNYSSNQLIIDSVTYSSNNYIFTNDNFAGDTIDYNQEVIGEISVNLLSGISQEISVNIYLNDYINNTDTSITLQTTITPKTQPVSVSIIEPDTISIGGIANYSFRGEIPYLIDTLGLMQFKININRYSLDLVEKTTNVSFYSESGNLLYEENANIDVNQNLLTISSVISNEIDYKLFKYWEFDLEFLALLNQSESAEIDADFTFADCFDQNSAFSEVIFNDICVLDLRHIDLMTKLESLEVNPNIVKNNLDVKFVLSEEKAVSFSLLDMTGKKAVIGEKIKFDKGKNNFIFNVSNFANGKYILNVRVGDLVYKKKIIILK